ncbi:SRSO17 transposase [Catenuloplanes nepalensis]|uniref:SRSO17 transposase n=1 Tax=Catenuloplanes nepalensis TaxID=587533 RepID=A0ABT9N5Z6_9ACTN|nr:IS701 family transposase [Catenuloplanes nepalensis]MDP9798666.1 SRSO17 transposase [Catenuloplanes nepalensis]
MKTTKSQAAAAARIEAAQTLRSAGELLERLRSCFVRTQTWQHAGRYVSALVSEIPKRNGWTIAQQAGDRTPDRTQRLLNRAVWDEQAAMSAVRRFVVTGLDTVAGRRTRRGLRIGALDETGQQKAGTATAGVKRQYMGCAGRVANGINTVHLAYVRERVGHALIAVRQWIPAEHLADADTAAAMGIADGPAFRTKGQLAIDLRTDAYADGVVFDFVCGDEVYGNCTELREFLEDRQQAYVLRVASTFMLTLHPETRMTCANAITELATGARRWQVRSAGAGAKGQRWYAWAWIATISPRHHLLVRRHLSTGELAFHYCYVPHGQPLTLARLVRAAGLRWPVEETFEFGKDRFGLDQCQTRLHTAIVRHTVLVMTALAICAIAAARLKTRTDTQAPPPAHTRPAATVRARHDRVDHPRDRTAARHHLAPAEARRPRHPLARRAHEADEHPDELSPDGPTDPPPLRLIEGQGTAATAQPSLFPVAVPRTDAGPAPAATRGFGFCLSCHAGGQYVLAAVADGDACGFRLSHGRAGRSA